MNNKKTIDNKRIYKEIHKRVGSKMKEQATEKDLDTQKALNKELEKTQDLQKKIKDISENDAIERIPNSALTAINQQVKNPATMAALVLDFIEKVQEKESIKFENNSKFKQAIQRLEDLARSTNREDTEDMEEVKESLVKEITRRVKQKLSEATKEEETKFHKKLDKLVHDTFGKRKEEIGEAKLDFMGTADEETMKYLLQDISRDPGN
jgi:ABC-type transporter Mla subunit MlaD